MKKILLSLILLTTLGIKAQDNWLSNGIPSISYYGTFTGVHSFGGKIYVFTSTEGTLGMYASTGDTASYTEVTSFYNAVSPSNIDGVNAITSDNNNMYLGTSGSYYAPQVYKFDGDTLTLDTIPFDTVSTHPNRVLASNSPSIGALTIFNSNVYAFANPGYGGSDTLVASVWSHPVSGGSWTNTTNFSKGSGIQWINDAVVYQGKIYISVNRIDSTDAEYDYDYYRSSILSSADGANWDTVAEMLPYLVSIGQFNQYGPTYNHFEVHNDTLLVSINSPYGVPPILYTTDASANTWHSFIANYSNYGTLYDGVQEFQSYLGKLWIKSGDGDSYPITVFRYEGDTLKGSTNPIDISSAYANGSTKIMTGLGNTLYFIDNPGGGALLKSGHQHASQQSTGSSSIYRLTAPVANFADSASAGFCSSNWIDFYNTSTNAGYNKWYINDTLVTSSYNETTYVYTYTPSSIAISGGDTSVLQNSFFDINFNTAGTYTVKLVAYSTSDPSSLVDSITKTLTINQSPIIDSVRTDIGGSSLSFTVCQGQPVTFTTYPLNQTNCEYKWTYMNYNTSVIEDSTSTNPGTTSTFTYVSGNQGPPEYYNSMQIVNTVNGCHTSWSSAVDIWVNQSDSLFAVIKDPSGAFAIKGQVYLFKQKANHVGVADTTNIQSLGPGTNPPAGYAIFYNAFYGDYYVQASLDNTMYPSALTTYYTNPVKNNAYQWDSATVFQHYGCTGSTDTLKILVEQLQSSPGTATISGHIYKDPTYGLRLVHGGNNSVMGAPLKGVGVSLGKSPGGGCAARTTTGSTGSDSSYYEFTNVDTGSYQIFVDIPNYGMVSIRDVNITGSDSSINNDYHVDSNKIYIDTTTASGIFTQSKVNSTGVKLYPNPAGSIAYIDFYNNQDAPVAASLYDISGNLISTLANEKMPQGTQSIKINLADMKLDAGVYIIRANLNNSIQNFKLTVIQN